MKKNLLTIIVSLVLALVFVMILFVFQVRQSEVAVVTRFGKPVRDVTQPGAYFRMPPGIESVYKLDQRIQNFEDSATETYTADGNNLLTAVYVGWRISDAKAFFPKFRNGSVKEAERNLRDIVTAAKQNVVSKHPLADFVNANEKELKFDVIEKEIKEAVQKQLQANNSGIQLEYLGLKRMGLPESVTESVFALMTADRKKLADKLNEEGSAEARKIRSSADREAAQKISTAEGEARRIKGQGDAVAAAVYPVFQQNPELAKFLLDLEALEASLKERSILIFDSRTTPFNLLTGSFTNKLSK
jgi:membrane protease subunit HflC